MSTVRLPAHMLIDGKYPILEDQWEETQYGRCRSLILQAPASKEIDYHRTVAGPNLKVWLPKSCPSPQAPLVGRTLVKSTLPNISPNPYYGYTYVILFE
jgi:hypothetical protein